MTTHEEVIHRELAISLGWLVMYGEHHAVDRFGAWCVFVDGAWWRASPAPIDPEEDAARLLEKRDAILNPPPPPAPEGWLTETIDGVVVTLDADWGDSTYLMIDREDWARIVAYIRRIEGGAGRLSTAYQHRIETYPDYDEIYPDSVRSSADLCGT